MGKNLLNPVHQGGVNFLLLGFEIDKLYSFRKVHNLSFKPFFCYNIR